MKRFIHIAFLLVLLPVLTILLLVSCDRKPTPKPAISGKLGEVAVITSKANWESEIGNAVRSILADDYGYLPQQEPKFNLFNVPKQSLSNIFQMHRNMLYLNIEDTCTLGMKVRHDVWAHPQTMLIVTAPDASSAVRFITENGEKIADVFENAERDRAVNNAIQFEEKSLRELVEITFGGSPYFPNGYSLKKRTDDFYWISYETSFTNQGIFIYKFPYSGTFQFTPTYLVEKRDEVMKANVPATREGSYMITNPMIVPGYKKVTFNDIEFTEIRSLWDTYNDFMGGPFISRAFLSQDQSEMIVIEGFVYAPKYNKRDYLRQLDYILSSFHWKDNSTN
jgi:hypothetical protein